MYMSRAISAVRYILLPLPAKKRILCFFFFLNALLARITSLCLSVFKKRLKRSPDGKKRVARR
jgi:hypothetical protein